MPSNGSPSHCVLLIFSEFDHRLTVECCVAYSCYPVQSLPTVLVHRACHGQNVALK